MLDSLPIEILEIIVGHLPTSSSVLNLALSNQKLHEKISADKYALLKSFVQNRFPSVSTPPFWLDATIALTARSRAWDRRAFVARECRLPGNDVFPGTRTSTGLKTGFMPAIDSFETWTGGTWAEKTEVLAWGAAGRLRLRTSRNGKATWSTYRTPFDHAPQNDVLDVRLLRREQNQNMQGETIFLRRANNTIAKIKSQREQDIFIHEAFFNRDPKSQNIDSMDVSGAVEPLLVVCNSMEVNLYRTNSKEASVESCDVLQLEHHRDRKCRMRCAKFLSPDRFAMAPQFLDGRLRAPIEVHTVSPSGIRASPTYLRDATLEPVVGRHSANAIAPLDATSTLVGRPGDIFLSGWTDGVVRMFDLRSGAKPTTEYLDTVDDGQILSLLPIGHERFLAGSHQNACLKTFDLRMGARAYSYMQASMPKLNKRSTGLSANRSNDFYTTHRDINIFLALNVPRARRLWEPLPQRPDPNMPRYRGPIYSLSSPSPSSPTVFAGIENHVIQLDFVSTDDCRRSRIDYLGLDISSGIQNGRSVLDLSCYERPQRGYEIFDPVLLRKQADSPSLWSTPEKHSSRPSISGDRAEDGWDERWRLSRPKSSLAWR